MPTSQDGPAATAERPTTTTEVAFAPTCPSPGEVRDEREQTFNEGRTGPVHAVSTPADLITSLNKIMLDVDPKFLRHDLYAGTDGPAAERLFGRTLGGWLDRHPLLKSAQVRSSGTGLHVLQHLDPPVEFRDTSDRDRWAAIVRVVQSTLPSDPHAPGLTALTRPVGSVNGKSGQRVAVLRPGTPVHPDAVAAFVGELHHKPFSIIARILYGSGAIRPCPVCRGGRSSLQPRDRVGKCYRCGTITLARLLGTVMVDPAAAAEGN